MTRPPQSVHYLLIDISNSFTKIAFSDGKRLGKPVRVPTKGLSVSAVERVVGRRVFDRVVFSSVVPKRNDVIFRALGKKTQILKLDASVDLGICIRYPKPQQIGADRIANAVACSVLYGVPAIVVDFGTAVTFDVIDDPPAYLGGVIAPGLNAMTNYLHEKTALLPSIKIREPKRAVGQSTEEAMLVGAVYGYRGLIKEIVAAVSKEAFGKRSFRLVATGGDAKLIAKGLNCFDAVDPNLTLHGLRLVALRT